MRLRKSCERTKGFTLIELIVVVVIIGILAAVTIPSYTITKERTYDREAIAALKLIRVANRQYYSKSDVYYPTSGTASLIALNENLSLDLSGSVWQYQIASSGTGAGFTATASRSSRTWRVQQGVAEPTCSGSCF